MTTKGKLLISVGLTAAVVATLFLWLHNWRASSEPKWAGVKQQFPRGRPPSLQETNSEPELVVAAPVILTLTAQQALERVRELTKAAKFYKYDSNILAFREKTNRIGHHIVFSTPSHAAEVLNGRVLKLMSFRDNSSGDHRDPDAMKSWHEGTGQWTEEDAVNETLAILKRIQDTNTLNAVAAGRREFMASPITVTTPEGEKVRVAPFHTIRMYDADNTLRIKAEYRVGPTGVVGLTDWFNNR